MQHLKAWFLQISSLSKSALFQKTLARPVNSVDFSQLNAKFLQILDEVTPKLGSLEHKTQIALFTALTVIVLSIFFKMFSPLVAVLGFVILFQVVAILKVHYQTHLAQKADHDLSETIAHVEEELEEAKRGSFGSLSTVHDDHESIGYYKESPAKSNSIYQ